MLRFFGFNNLSRLV